MNRLMWLTPRWVHELIHKITGLRLVRIQMDDGRITGYVWTREYPLR